MSFTIFKKDNYIVATEIMDNFYYIGQGHLLPYDGTSLTAIDSTYDLGEDDTRWNYIIADELNINKGGECDRSFTLYGEVEITTTTVSLEISGLSGDTDEIYFLTFHHLMDPTTSSKFQNIYMFFNNDSVSNYYTGYYIRGFSTALATTFSNTGFIRVFDFATSLGQSGSIGASLYINGFITCNSSFTTAWTGWSADYIGTGGSAYAYSRSYGTWSSGNTELTTINFWGDTGVSAGVAYFLTGSSLKIWKKT
jgi:hypothetical protein